VIGDWCFVHCAWCLVLCEGIVFVLLVFFVASVFGIVIRAFRVIRGQILTEIPRSRFGLGWNGMENGD
jgi:hypothetical protein